MLWRLLQKVSQYPEKWVHSASVTARNVQGVILPTTGNIKGVFTNTPFLYTRQYEQQKSNIHIQYILRY
jgi:hypothetical protein